MFAIGYRRGLPLAQLGCYLQQCREHDSIIRVIAQARVYGLAGVKPRETLLHDFFEALFP
jgi:hypothetical protein